MQSFKMRDHAGSLAIIVVAAVLALGALTWAGFDFRLVSQAYIGDRGDTLLNSWTISQALDNLRFRPLDPGYSRIFYGEPASFAYTIAPYGIALLLLPVYALTGGNLVLSYNLYIVATFVLSAWIGFLLIRHLLNARTIPAMIAALMIAFAQRRFAHLTHVETLSLHFLLLTVYCLHRTLSSRRIGWAVGLGIAAAFTLVTSGYLTMMAVVISVVIVIFLLRWQLLLISPTSPVLRRLAIASIVAGICVAPFSLYRIGNATFRYGYSMDEIVGYAISPQSWVVGNSQLYTRSNLNMESAFLGFTPLLLALLGWWWRRQSEDGAAANNLETGTIRLTTQQVIVIYACVTVVAYLLTLGPIFKWDGKEVMPLPTMLLYQLPGYALMRAPGRFIHVAVIGTAILSAHALNRLHGKRFYGSLIVLVIGALVAELLPWNGVYENRISRTSSSSRLIAYPFTTNDDVYAWLREQDQTAPIMHYPLHTDGEYQYAADLSRHPQPMLNGWGSFLPEWYYGYGWERFPSLGTMNFIWKRGIRFLLVHRELLSDKEDADLQKRIAVFNASNGGGLTVVQQFKTVTVYQIPEQIAPMEFAFDQGVPGNGWQAPVLANGRILTWMNSPTATIELDLAQKRDYEVTLVVVDEAEAGLLDTLTLNVGDTPISFTRARSDDGEAIHAVIPAAAVSGGRSVTPLTLHIDHVRSPADLGQGDDRTPRGLAFTRLVVTPK
ncbi:MAG: hypothetical protein KF716_17105 [Anaerolineae bacterium]|nr:hypothetical protein [Anaerolineae bacterium]